MSATERMAMPMPIATVRLPRTAWCCTCDKQLGTAQEPQEEIGPFNHLTVYPDHYVVEAEGGFYVWRGTTAPSAEETTSMSPDEFVSALERIESVARIQLQPGDVLLVKTDREVTAEEAGNIRRTLRRSLPDHEAIVVPPGFDISTLKVGVDLIRRPMEDR